MKFEKFTTKSREAIADSQNLAGRLGNPEIRPGHLLVVLLDQDGGVVPSVLRNLGANPEMLQQRCLLYTSPSPRDLSTSRMPSSA